MKMYRALQQAIKMLSHLTINVLHFYIWTLKQYFFPEGFTLLILTFALQFFLSNLFIYLFLNAWSHFLHWCYSLLPTSVAFQILPLSLFNLWFYDILCHFYLFLCLQHFIISACLGKHVGSCPRPLKGPLVFRPHFNYFKYKSLAFRSFVHQFMSGRGYK